MKTREGIYFGNREIVERYIGGKLVWQKGKEVLVYEGKATLNTQDSTKKLISIRYRSNEVSIINPLSPYMTMSTNGVEAVIKNSYMLLNNKKYKHVTVIWYHHLGDYINSDFILKIKFLSQIDYDEVLKQFAATKKLPVNIISVVKK